MSPDRMPLRLGVGVVDHRLAGGAGVGARCDLAGERRGLVSSTPVTLSESTSKAPAASAAAAAAAGVPGAPCGPLEAALGHRARDRDRVQREAARGVLDAVERGDLGDLRRREAELRGGHEVGARELLARLRLLVEVEAPRPVLLLELVALRLPRGRPGPLPSPSSFSGRVTDMSVPTPVSGSSTFCLRLVEAGAERADRDDEADADAEAERGEERAALAAAKLGDRVGEIEHGASIRRAPKSGRWAA